jgi:ABC-2 type transport system ATP-binding protein
MIGYMPDFFGVYEDLTVHEYLDFFAAAFSIPFSKRKGVIGDVLELTDLSKKSDSPVEGLSRGMKQRLSIARLLLHDPELLLLDEPASGLDPRARIEIRELFKELKSMGKTILISSHILSELASLCTRIGIIEAGKLVVEGSMTDIIKELSVKRKVHIQIANISEDLCTKIEKIKGVTHVEQQADRLSVEIKEEILSIEELLCEVQKAGFSIHMFQPDAIDMETVFMKLTQGRLA